ncbi:MAG: hypothetical protein HFH82_04875 [Lachnospiraceae bacterium]|nr:hypothetical protein [Lachnospiraceae bacterium]
MTKRVAVPGKQQRAGGGVRPVQVGGWGRSLLSSRSQRKGISLQQPQIDLFDVYAVGKSSHTR